jgi:antibiotic biosynthesis monooxygenase (ABM) superfamily enzyme
MIRRIVLWRVRGDTAEQREQHAQEIKTTLEALRGKIPGMLHIEVGLNFNPSQDASDVVLIVEFDDMAALERYKNHPEHDKLKPRVGVLRTERRVVDYEINAVVMPLTESNDNK